MTLCKGGGTWGLVVMGDQWDVIRLRGLSAVANHGVFEFERESGQTFTVDLTLFFDATTAAETDDLADTINYAAIADEVIAILQGPAVNLLETLASAVAATALDHPGVVRAEATVHKPMAPIPHQFQDISVTVARERAVASKKEVVVLEEPTSDEAVALAEESEVVAEPTRGPELRGKAPVEGEPAPKSDSDAEDVEEDSSADGAAEEAADEVASEDEVPEEPVGEEPVAEPAAAEEARAGGDDAQGPVAAATPGEGAERAETPVEDTRPAESPFPKRAERTARRLAKHAAELEFVNPYPTRRAAQGRPTPKRLGEEGAEQAGDHVYNVVLALGSNRGDVVGNLLGAVAALVAHPDFEVVDVSPLVRTKPVLEPGALPQPDFQNAIVLGKTTMSPPVLLEATQQIEADFGRVRGVKWSARPLDIDIVAIDKMQFHTRSLTVPHHLAHERAFVLYPWSLVDEDAVVPGRGRVADLLEAAPDLGGVKAIRRSWLSDKKGDTPPEEPLSLSAAKPEEDDAAVVEEVVIRGFGIGLKETEEDPLFRRLLSKERAALEEAAPAPTPVSAQRDVAGSPEVEVETVPVEAAAEEVPDEGSAEETDEQPVVEVLPAGEGGEALKVEAPEEQATEVDTADEEPDADTAAVRRVPAPPVVEEVVVPAEEGTSEPVAAQDLQEESEPEKADETQEAAKPAEAAPQEPVEPREPEPVEPVGAVEPGEPEAEELGAAEPGPAEPVVLEEPVEQEPLTEPSRGPSVPLPQWDFYTQSRDVRIVEYANGDGGELPPANTSDVPSQAPRVNRKRPVRPTPSGSKPVKRRKSEPLRPTWKPRP